MVRRAFHWALARIWREWQAIHDATLEAPPPAVRAGSRGAAALGGSRPLDYRPLVILVAAALSLTFQEYWGERSAFAQLVPPSATDRSGGGYWELGSFAWWAGWRVFGYLVLPMGVLALLPGERIRDYGLSVAGFTRHVWIYVVLFLAVLPLVVFFSTTKAFQQTYPFYKLAGRSRFDLVSWELLYSAQFLSLEFFFRGFLLHGLKRSLGVHSIWVMVVPYCMIHYGKPMPETIGAIGAGLILGTLSLRTRSIWCGVLIHISVALTMDLLSLSHRIR